MSKYTVLIVDDEQDIVEFVSYNLKKEGFEVHTTNNGNDAIRLAKKLHPHIILLDIMMPGMDGIETCEELRKIPELNDVAIALLTARGEDYSQIAGFEAGADDYITKPIKPKVLVSRLGALLKRTAKSDKSKHIQESTQLTTGNFRLDKEQYLVYIKNEQISLPRKEFKLLLLLYSKPGKVFTREEIYSQIWGSSIIVGDRTIDVHIRKLREKIGEDHIKTIKGIGYKFVE